MCILEYLISVSTSVCASIIAGVALLVIQRFRYWYYLVRRYDECLFDVFGKGVPKSPLYRVSCSVKKNTIKYKGDTPASINIPESHLEGEFIIDPLYLKTGNGYHIHANYDGFNFPKIIIKDKNTFLIETSYIEMKVNENQNQYGEIRHLAYIWRKVTNVI